jgi:phage gp46-like protein
MKRRKTVGDPEMVLTPDGMDLVYKGGQPVMDGGIGNAVLVTLLSEEWVANPLVRSPMRLGGKFLEATKKAITVSALNEMRVAAIADLQWMIDEKVASKIDVVVSNPKHDRIEVVVIVKPPAGDLKILQISKYGPNWVSQALDPRSLVP